MSEWIFRIGAADERLLRALTLRRRPWLTHFMRVYTHFGDAPVPVGIALLLLMGAVPGMEAMASHVAFSLGSAFLLSQLLKRAISRPRPKLPVGLSTLIEPPDRFSFPSGHATASLAVALPMALALGGVLLPALVVASALLVGLSRCYLGVHYPGDVLVGWGIAVISALGCAVLLG